MYATDEGRKAAKMEYATRYRGKKRKGNGSSETANAPRALVAAGDDALVAKNQGSLEVGEKVRMGLVEFQGELEEAGAPPSANWDSEWSFAA